MKKLICRWLIKWKTIITSQNISKTGLSAFDIKRYSVDAVRSYAYGHYKIGQAE